MLCLFQGFSLGRVTFDASQQPNSHPNGTSLLLGCLLPPHHRLSLVIPLLTRPFPLLQLAFSGGFGGTVTIVWESGTVVSSASGRSDGQGKFQPGCSKIQVHSVETENIPLSTASSPLACLTCLLMCTCCRRCGDKKLPAHRGCTHGAKKYPYRSLNHLPVPRAHALDDRHFQLEPACWRSQGYAAFIE